VTVPKKGEKPERKKAKEGPQILCRGTVTEQGTDDQGRKYGRNLKTLRSSRGERKRVQKPKQIPKGKKEPKTRERKVTISNNKEYIKGRRVKRQEKVGGRKKSGGRGEKAR